MGRSVLLTQATARHSSAAFIINCIIYWSVIIMPYKAPKPCAWPGCPELTHSRYCAKHTTMANRERREAEGKSHYDRRWRKIRALYLSKHPLCHDCEEAGRLIPATEVHHILPIQDGGKDNDENLMGLCKSCHSRRTMEENKHRVY